MMKKSKGPRVVLESEEKKEDTETERCIVTCTPQHAFSDAMLHYIENQINSPRKKWIYDIIDGLREQENVLLDTPEFVFLPDTHAINDGHVYNWMAVVKDRSLWTLRNLTGDHVPLLKRVKLLCVEQIMLLTGWKKHNIMAYVHYLPSVFQLHIHFCAPYGSYTTVDVFKMQPLDMVIKNLEIDSDYYKKANLTTVVVGNSRLMQIYGVGNTLDNALQKQGIIDWKRKVIL